MKTIQVRKLKELEREKGRLKKAAAKVALGKLV
jgi:hypothetical protein